MVQFLTTACTDVLVTGYMYNSGVTDFSKDIIDTATGSTWFASFYDGSYGGSVSGGSAAALAPAHNRPRGLQPAWDATRSGCPAFSISERSLVAH